MQYSPKGRHHSGLLSFFTMQYPGYNASKTSIIRKMTVSVPSVRSKPLARRMWRTVEYAVPYDTPSTASRSHSLKEGCSHHPSADRFSSGKVNNALYSFLESFLKGSGETFFQKSFPGFYIYLLLFHLRHNCNLEDVGEALGAAGYNDSVAALDHTLHLRTGNCVREEEVGVILEESGNGINAP